MSDVTRILQSIEQGNARASDELLPLVYDELRKLAAHRMAVIQSSFLVLSFTAELEGCFASKRMPAKM
jgi:hypothetical protein